MNRFGILTMLAGLLATASAVNAQATAQPPVSAPKPLIIAVPGAVFEVPPEEACAMERCWHVQACQQAVAAWQRMRAICAGNTGCCEAAAKTAGCPLCAAGRVKSSETAQTPKACACVKECACCESCKATRAASPRTQAQPMSPEMIQRIAGLHGIAQPQPFPTANVPPCMPTAQIMGFAQVMPTPSFQVIQVVHVAHPAKPVHFVTPDLDAVCQRMHHHGDTIVLEGNVMLLCKKHAQPIRIEAQRVVVNMKDGSFTVEANAGPMPPSNFGVQRTSGVSEAPAYQTIPGAGIRIAVPMLGPLPMGSSITLPCPANSAPRSITTPRDEPLFRGAIPPIPGR